MHTESKNEIVGKHTFLEMNTLLLPTMLTEDNLVERKKERKK